VALFERFTICSAKKAGPIDGKAWSRLRYTLSVPGKTTLEIHHIELFPNTRPIHCTPYRLSPVKAKVLKEELSNLVRQGIVEESNSPWASPIVMVPKADGTLRLCTDLRKVNSVTVPDPFPLPRIEDLLDRIGKSKYLTKLDMTRGYWQVPLDDVSAPISAFVTPYGHFQWRYMPFGLRDAPATFSRLVSKLLMGLESFSLMISSFLVTLGRSIWPISVLC